MTTAIITGAGRGIGRGIALRLARDGHAVAVNDVNKAGAESVGAEIAAAGGRSLAVPADVTDRAAVFAMVEQVAAELGSVDVMVANAGIAQVKTILELTPEDTLVFRDHQRYVPRDLERIRHAAAETGSSGIVTTEKDAVKLWGRVRLPIVAVRLSVEVLEPGFFPFLASRLPRADAGREAG